MKSKVPCALLVARFCGHCLTLVFTSVHHREALTPDELVHARELLWGHFEGTEPGLDRMKQPKPHGWKRGDPKTWTQGIDGKGNPMVYGEGAMTSTTHCVRRCV